MAKPILKANARELRRQGISVGVIAQQLGVARSSVSYWVRDINLSVAQLERLKKRSLSGAEKGRIKGAMANRRKMLRIKKEAFKNARMTIEKLSKHELMLVGTALYWAEGAKKHRKVSFCNSNPEMVRLLINWLESGFGVDKARFAAYVGINQIHKSREKEILAYWRDITGFDAIQFRKTSFKKTRLIKTYDNMDTHFGTLTVYVLKPARLYYKILGLIDALAMVGSK